MPSPTQLATVDRVIIKKSLEGQDDNLDLLQSYFQELKAVTVEPSAPDVDMLTFATCTHYFGVIAIEPRTQQDENDEDAEGEPEEDSIDVGYVASPPPPSIMSTSSATSFTSARSARPKDPISKLGRSDIHLTTPEEEKVLKWREAFLAQLQEGNDEEKARLSKGKMPESHNIQSILEECQNVNVSNPSMSNDLDDYINWPDDIPSNEDAGAQGGDFLDHETEMYSRLDEDEFTTILGREILEPEQFSSPVELPEIPADPDLKAFVYEEAIKFRDALRAQRIQAYQEASGSRPTFVQPLRSKSTPIGIVYLASSQNVDDPMHRGQLNIGIYVAPDYIGQQGLVGAVKQVVSEAFRDINCHRVQAIIVDHKTKLHTMELYTSIGFSREGIGRRVFFSPVTHEWKDVFYFAILDTDWVYDNSSGFSSSVRLRRPKSLWDDLLICQQRERDELLRMEEKTLKRCNSIETIRDKAPTASSIASASRSESSSVANSSMSTATTSSAGRKQSPKRRRLGVESGKMKEWSTRRSSAPSSSTSSSMGTIDTMSTISSEWELPARQAFTISASNGASLPITPNVSASKSTSSTGHWVMLDVSKKARM